MWGGGGILFACCPFVSCDLDVKKNEGLGKGKRCSCSFREGGLKTSSSSGMFPQSCLPSLESFNLTLPSFSFPLLFSLSATNKQCSINHDKKDRLMFPEYLFRC